MALLADGRLAAGMTAVEGRTKAIRTASAPRGLTYSQSVTGLIPTASAAGAPFLVMRSNPSTSLMIFIERVHVQLTTQTAFSSAYTSGRRIALYRGSGAAASGGVAVTPPVQKDPAQTVSQIAQASGGDFRVTVGSALTTTGITWEANSIREAGLTHMGLAGSNYDVAWEFHPTENAPVILQPGLILGLRTPVAFDAGGVVQFSINIDWHESVAWNSTLAD